MILYKTYSVRKKNVISWFMMNEASAIPVGSCFALNILSPKTIRIHNVSHNGTKLSLNILLVIRCAVFLLMLLPTMLLFDKQPNAKALLRSSTEQRAYTGIHLFHYFALNFMSLAKLNIKWQYIYLDAHSSSSPQSRQSIHNLFTFLPLPFFSMHLFFAKKILKL